MKKCRCIIAGSRDFDNYKLMERYTIGILNDFISGKDISFGDIEIVEGGARGPDKLAFYFAEAMKLKHTRFDADWDKHGKSAGHVRNADMAIYAAESEHPILIAFWNRTSKGTAGMISVATRKDIKVVVVDTNTLTVEVLN